MTNKINFPVGATPLEPEELEGLKYSHVTTRSELDHLEAANISQGFIWLSRQKSPDILLDSFARNFHKQLFGDVWTWAGRYRQTEKNIGIDPLQISVKVRELMDDVRYWVDNSVYQPLEIAARFHHKLVYIHPFTNGNGRHARYMADALMEIVYHEPAITWGKQQDDTDTSQETTVIRNKYISALQKADQGNYHELLKFVGLSL